MVDKFGRVLEVNLFCGGGKDKIDTWDTNHSKIISASLSAVLRRKKKKSDTCLLPSAVGWIIKYCFSRSWPALCAKFAIWRKEEKQHHVINILLIMTPSPFNSAKNLVGYIWIKRHIHTVYTLESVFNPRYRSENADAAIWGEKQNKTQV